MERRLFFRRKNGAPNGEPLWRKWLPAGVLMLVALLIRLPWLWEVPRFIDELREVELGFKIYKLQALALHNVAHDIGAFYNYILAALFASFGPNIYWPRLFIALTSSVTVWLLYRLGRELYGRAAGWLAAGLLLTNGMQILVTHMAWANCATPFFFSLALLGTVRAEQQRNGQALFGVGLLWGLTLQTHSSVAVYMVTLAAYYGWREWRGPKLFSQRDYLRAIWGFGLGYCNMILYNLITVGGSLRWLHNKGYTLEQHPGLFSYFKNLGALVTELLRTLASSYAGHRFFWEYLNEPFFLICLVALGAGLYFACRDRQTLPVWLLAGGALTIPWLNHRYDFYIATRYIVPLVLCAMLLIGHGLVRGAGVVCRRAPALGRLKAGAVLVWLVLIALPLAPLYQYCADRAATDMSNRLSFEIVKTAQALARQSPLLVLLDARMGIENDPLPTLFTISGLAYQSFNTPDRPLQRNNWRKFMREQANRRILAVLAEPAFHKLRTLVPLTVLRRFRIRQLLGTPANRRVYEVYYLATLRK